MTQIKEPRVGIAGWSIASRHADRLPPPGSHLERYARALNAAEINSSFYKPHRRATYERWAASVGDDFRFSAKLPKEITHERRLVDCQEPLASFLESVGGLGPKLGALLVQLPPKLAFGAEAEAFFLQLRGMTQMPVALEPRHPSWASAEPMLREYRVARVAADPSRFSGDDRPAGWRGLAYFRLHGSPEIYRSDYSAQIAEIAARLDSVRSGGAEVWCIFDNTTLAHALPNALDLAQTVGSGLERRPQSTTSLASSSFFD